MIEQQRFIIIIVQPAEEFIKRTGIKTQKLDGTNVHKDIKELIARHSLKGKHGKLRSSEPEVLIFNSNRDDFLRTVADTLRDTNGNARDCFSSMILVVPEAEISSDSIDKTTGIRITNIKMGEPAYPMHPTPAH